MTKITGQACSRQKGMAHEDVNTRDPWEAGITGDHLGGWMSQPDFTVCVGLSSGVHLFSKCSGDSPALATTQNCWLSGWL